MPYLGRGKTGEGYDLFPVWLGTAGDIARSGFTDCSLVAVEKIRLKMPHHDHLDLREGKRGAKGQFCAPGEVPNDVG